MPITLEAKLKALREVESIYALAKKWQKLTPDEKPPNWERLADTVLQKALSEPVQPQELKLRVADDGQHHEQDPESARRIERTLRNGLVHPDVLHSFQHDVTTVDPDVTPAPVDPGYDSGPTSNSTCTTRAKPSTTQATSNQAPASTIPACTRPSPSRGRCKHTTRPTRGCPAPTRLCIKMFLRAKANKKMMF